MSTPYQPYPDSPPQGDGPAPQGAPGSRGYLNGGPANFGEAAREAFKNAFVYNGRASRSAYWFFSLFAGIIDIGIRVVPGAAGAAIAGLVGLALFFPSLAVAARRLHDSDRSGFWLFLLLLPIIGWIWLIVYYCLPGTDGPNKYDYRG